MARPDETVSQRSARPMSARERWYVSGKLLYGQGRPMAKDVNQAGEDFAEGITSENTGGTVTVESRLFFDGTVASSSSANDLSRATDAREKGRIGIFGSALAYAGSYGRVSSESIGRDLNPLGRGDGGSYVAGGMNLGRISPALPWNNSPGGWGNSVNNGCGSSGNSIGGPSGIGGDVSTTTCSDPSECKDAGIPPCCCCPWPCKNSPETGNIVGPAVRECSCPVECSRSGIRCTGELEPNWENFCDGVDFNAWSTPGSFGPGGFGGGCPGCGGPGHTGTWGPRDNGGGGGMPGFPPGWGIPGGGVTGPYRPLDASYPRGIMGVDPNDPSVIARGMVNNYYRMQHYSSRLDYCCRGMCSVSCKDNSCCFLEAAVRKANKDYQDLNKGLTVLAGFGAAVSLLFLLSGVGAPIAIGTALFFALLSVLLYGIGVHGQHHNIASSVSPACFQCVRGCLSGIGVNMLDEIAMLLGTHAVSFIPNPFTKLQDWIWNLITGASGTGGGYILPIGPWGDWLLPAPRPPYAL